MKPKRIAKPNMKAEITALRDRYASAQLNVDSYRTRNIQCEQELKLAQTKINELERDKQWLKQLVQNMSEALNAYMRNK